MKRVIVDYKKLTQNILDLLVEKYPDGYSDSDIISFRNAHNELVEAVEVRTDDTIFLVKVSIRLSERMEDEAIDDDRNDDIIPEEKGINFKVDEEDIETEEDEKEEAEEYDDEDDLDE